jgi:hypothetical protein
VYNKGDLVYVNCPARNVCDERPITGECEVVESYPNHICGASVRVRDEYGETTVLEAYTILLRRKE